MSSQRRTAIWSPEAEADLHAIWDYYAQVAGPATADKFVREIGAAVATIEAHPFSGRARDELRTGVRSLATSPHIVFYRVLNNVPEIIRVLDGRRDIEELFADETGQER